MSFFIYLWSYFIKLGRRFMVLFMIWRLHEADFVESFDVIWERVCRDIFSMIDSASRSEYACRKRHSYYSPLSSNDDHQRASPHDLCLQHFDALIHDLGIHNIFTKTITKKLLFQIIQMNKRTYRIHFLLFVSYPVLRGGFVPWVFPPYLG